MSVPLVGLRMMTLMEGGTKLVLYAASKNPDMVSPMLAMKLVWPVVPLVKL